MITFQKVLFASIAFFALTFTACKKDKFDEPPHETVDPNLPVTHSIYQLKGLLTGTNIKLTDDIIISGIVVANDKSGNLFNQIIIDDGTAGISVAIDQNALFGEFPVGRKIYVKCKDLYLYNDNGLIGLYGAIDLANEAVEIPSTLISKYIVKANTGNTVTPIPRLDFNALNDSFLNRLVTISNVEFDAAAADQPYADAINKVSMSRVLKYCNGTFLVGTVEVRTSGYALFANTKTPKGKGTITGIYTKYVSSSGNVTKQFVLRDITDVNMNGIKCDGSDPNAAVLLDEKFTTVTDNVAISVNNWSTYISAGSKNWIGRNDATITNPYAQMSAFSSSASQQEPSNISWLISPAINLNNTTGENLSFSSYAGFHSTPALLELVYSTNYTGSGNPNLATWTNLSATFATINSWTPSGNISLNGISGTAFHIAFRYTGGYSPTTQTTQFRLDNIKITGM